MPHPASGQGSLPPQAGRVDWVDIAKGFCIVFVVMMHSTLGVEAAAGETGFMGLVVAFAKPFRIPDFFLIAGLFLPFVIDRPWARYFDRKVLHFAYFYALWVTIQFAFKAPAFASEYGPVGAVQLYLLSFVEPFGTLWFIYMLPIFFALTKAVRHVPVWIVFSLAAVLEIAPIHTGWLLIDEFASRYVYFYLGYALASHLFALAERVRAHALLGFIGVAAWALTNGLAVFSGVADWPFVSLLVGLMGASAVVAVSVLLTTSRIGEPLRYAGERSLIIYLAFFLPMAVTRTVLLKTGIIPDVGMISLLVTLAGVVGPLVFASMIARLGILGFLFERPSWARLNPMPRRGLVPAE